MYPRLIIPAMLVTVLLIAGCSQNNTALSDADQAAITQQVLKAGRAFEAAAVRLDPNLITDYCADTPDFVFLASDGTGYNYAELKNLWAGFISAFSSQTNPLRTVKVIVLSRDTALFSWQGGGQLTQKDGVVLNNNPISGTDLFKKINGQWKVIYIHESGNPPAPVKGDEVKPQQ